MLGKVISGNFYLHNHYEAPPLKEREAYAENLYSQGHCSQSLLPATDYALRTVHSMNLKDEECNTLIDDLYFSRFARQKLLSASFLQERLAYIAIWKAHGASVALLRSIANYQLHTINYLKLTELRSVSENEIQKAALEWSVEKGIKGRKDDSCSYAQKRFLRISKGWLFYLGLWQEEKAPIPFSDYLLEYLDWLATDRGYAAWTIEGRYSQLKIFFQEVSLRHQSFSDMAPVDIDAFLHKRHNEDGCSRLTIITMASIIRGFLQYAESRGWCEPGLSLSIKVPRVYHLDGLPSSPPWESVQKIIKDKNTTAPIDIRDYAILLLLAVYGLRCSEVTCLKLKDLDWRNEQLLLHRAKNCNPQVFPLPAYVGDAILRYIQEVRQNESHLEYVFLCMRSPWRPLSNTAIYRIVSAGLRGEGLALKHYGPHTLRHGCATRLINSDFSLKEIADQLGHQQLDTTRIYAKVDLTNLRKVADMNWEEIL